MAGRGAVTGISGVQSQADLVEVAALLREYAGTLPFALDFQGFEVELASLPGAYAPPQGRLLLARIEDAAAGCIALRPIDSVTAEIKRLYVRPAFRGRQLGWALASAIIAEAHAIGYRRLVLDTIADMVAALSLYARLGFRPTEAYTYNPLPGACFLELTLSEGSDLLPR